MDQAWDFFSSAENLQEITPPDMRMVILDEGEKQSIYAGQIISYKLSPMRGIWLRWTTEISHCVPGEYFVDEQRFGPFSFWHHKHFIRPVDGGVVMEDMIHYALPFGFIGRWVHRLVIRNRVKNIFDFRERAMAEMFS